MPTDNHLGFKYESNYTGNGMICSSEEQNMCHSYSMNITRIKAIYVLWYTYLGILK